MRALIAGFGNMFFNDDGFGPEVVRALAARPVVLNAHVRDFGIGGMHLALEMLEPYDLVLLIDAIARDDAPGTLFVIEPGTSERRSAPDAHAMDVRDMLSLYEQLRRDLEVPHTPEILIVGCVPQNIDEGMALSDPVRAAVAPCVDLVGTLLDRYERRFSSHTARIGAIE
jgi:hydrogenase maturation protease